MGKRGIVRLLSVIGAVVISVNISNNVFASDSISIIYSQKNNGIETRSEVYEWVVKYENGKVYRRLFNVTRGYFVGEWEVVG